MLAIVFYQLEDKRERLRVQLQAYRLCRLGNYRFVAYNTLIALRQELINNIGTIYHLNIMQVPLDSELEEYQKLAQASLAALPALRQTEEPTPDEL